MKKFNRIVLGTSVSTQIPLRDDNSTKPHLQMSTLILNNSRR